jgi:hypothetical protein
VQADGILEGVKQDRVLAKNHPCAMFSTDSMSSLANSYEYESDADVLGMGCKQRKAILRGRMLRGWRETEATLANTRDRHNLSLALPFLV